jgi:hypothetical protein
MVLIYYDTLRYLMTLMPYTLASWSSHTLPQYALLGSILVLPYGAHYLLIVLIGRYGIPLFPLHPSYCFPSLLSLRLTRHSLYSPCDYALLCFSIGFPIR